MNIGGAVDQPLPGRIVEGRAIEERCAAGIDEFSARSSGDPVAFCHVHRLQSPWFAIGWGAVRPAVAPQLLDFRCKLRGLNGFGGAAASANGLCDGGEKIFLFTHLIARLPGGVDGGLNLRCNKMFGCVAV